MRQVETIHQHRRKRWHLFTDETPLRLLLLAEDKEYAAEIADCFQQAGAGSVITVKTATQARKLLNSRIIHGMLFEREMVDSCEQLIDAMDIGHLWFIPFSHELDNRDAVEALNTGRVAHYMVPPFSKAQAENVLRTLRRRIKD